MWGMHANVACVVPALAESPFYGDSVLLFAESDGMGWTWTASIE